MIYRIRVILDVRDDVFRDIEIQGSDTLEDLHEAIVRSFDLDGREMASCSTFRTETRIPR